MIPAWITGARLKENCSLAMGKCPAHTNRKFCHLSPIIKNISHLTANIDAADKVDKLE